MIELNEAENTRLLTLYSVMHPLMDRYRLANYHMTIQSSESTKLFHDMVEAIYGTNIDIGEFIGIHAIGACVDGSTDILLKEAMPILQNSAREKLDTATFEKMNAWLEGMKMNPDALASSDPWSKLGGLCKHAYYLDVFSEDTADYLRDDDEDNKFSDIIAEKCALVEACKGINDKIDAYAAGLVQNMRNALQLAMAEISAPNAQFIQPPAP